MKIIQIDKKHPELLEEETATLEQLSDDLAQRPIVYVAMKNNKVVATCTVEPEDKKWKILRLDKNESFQGNGVGDKVLSECMDYAVKNQAKELILLEKGASRPAMKIKNGCVVCMSYFMINNSFE
ncbi:GNAT family N-acetyltransferase [Enterococcus olivae]